jgi:hypothetical protein
MDFEELTDFVVRCLPYTDTYKIQNANVLSDIAAHVVQRTLPLVEYIVEVA